MADAVVIKEFLVGLGFKDDPGKMARFLHGIAEATKRITGLGKTMVDTGKVADKAIGGITDRVTRLHEAARRPEFTEGLERWQRGMTEFTAATAAVALAVVKTVDFMDSMFFAAQRAGASAKEMEPWRKAAEDVGIGAETVDRTMGAMRLRMQTLPGLSNLLESFGVATKDAAGNARDMAQVWQDLIPALMARAKQLGPAGFAIVAQQAQMFGIDPATLQQLFDNWDRLTKARQGYLKMSPDDQKAADAGERLATQIRTLTTEFQKLAQGTVADLEPALKFVLDLFERILHVVIELNKETHGLVGALLGLVTAGAALKAVGAVLRLFGLGAAAGGAAGAAGAAGAGGGLLAGMGRLFGVGITGGLLGGIVAGALAWARPEVFGTVKKVFDDIFNAVAKGKAPTTGPTGIPLPQKQGDPGTFGWWMQQLGDFQEWMHRQGGIRPGATRSPGVTQRQLEGDYAAEQNAIDAPGAGAGGGARTRNTRMGGPRRGDMGLIDAIQAAESGGERDPVHALSPAGAQGLMQLMPDTGKELAGQVGEKYSPYDADQNRRLGARYISQLMDKYSGNLVEALAAYNWGMGNVDKWLRQTAGDFTKLPPETQSYITGILNRMGESSLLAGQPLYGGGSAHITTEVNAPMRTEIHVTGGGDPLQTGRAVASAQGRVGGDMIRNLRGLSQDFA